MWLVRGPSFSSEGFAKPASMVPGKKSAKQKLGPCPRNTACLRPQAEQTEAPGIQHHGFRVCFLCEESHYRALLKLTLKRRKENSSVPSMQFREQKLGNYSKLAKEPCDR